MYIRLKNNAVYKTDYITFEEDPDEGDSIHWVSNDINMFVLSSLVVSISNNDPNA